MTQTHMVWDGIFMQATSNMYVRIYQHSPATTCLYLTYVVHMLLNVFSGYFCHMSKENMFDEHNSPTVVLSIPYFLNIVAKQRLEKTV